MKNIINLISLIFITVSFSFATSFDSRAPLSEEERSTMIDLIVASSDLSEQRNAVGLVPINEYTSLLSITRAGDPSYILTKYVLDTNVMKFYLVPLITATNKTDFDFELNNVFLEGLKDFKLSVLESDINNFCSNENDSLVKSLGIEIKKEYLSEKRELLFSTVISSSTCWQAAF